jgi:uncharacterized protein
MEGKELFRKCHLNDHHHLMKFLLEEKAMNLFIIGDIENFGYEADFQDIYAQFDRNGDIEGVLLRYQNTYIPYAKTNIDLTNMIKVISEDLDLFMVSGKEELIGRIQEHFPFQKVKKTYFAELKITTSINKSKHNYIVKKASLDDVERLFELQEQIKEFDFGPSTKQSYKRTLETNTGRSFYLENQEGMVISLASTTAENAYSGMVVGVCSHPDERQKGLASIVMTELCQELLSEGKSLCLFYDNPKAGRIYKRLGFEDIGKWSMAYPN